MAVIFGGGGGGKLLKKKGLFMFSKKYEFMVFSVLMSFFMTLLMSFVVTFLNVGLVKEFLFVWLNAFLKSYPIGFGATLIVVPIVRKIVSKLVSSS